MNRFSFDPFPELNTANLLLRQLTEDDAESIFNIRSDRQIAKYLDRPLCQSKEEALQFINKINNGIRNGEVIYWSVCLKENPELAGTICLWNLSAEESKADIGFELLVKYQGRGFIQEAIDKVIEYGFTVMKLKNIIGETAPANIRSIRLMHKKGFVQTPAAEEAKNPDWVVYQLINPETQ